MLIFNVVVVLVTNSYNNKVEIWIIKIVKKYGFFLRHLKRYLNRNI